MNTSILIDQILREYKSSLNEDFDKYRHHVYRVYHICLLLDQNTEHHGRYAIAAAFHDLGIWTNNTFDYLKPSVGLANQWLIRENKSEWSEEISEMIEMHHKVTPYSGLFENTVEVFRKADWIDLSFGMLSFGIARWQLRLLMQVFPTQGFHRFLVRKTCRNFIRHPFKPLPMFRK